ncbi:hypothetical protein [Lysobacter antibioticus]|uniref:hypothetical protein n=1 Tax=Lysobacter antibioticus TaxID=84531 RepID=UPI0007167648|nr:hypothetical protein [Lysobacter antibioticus]
MIVAMTDIEQTGGMRSPTHPVFFAHHPTVTTEAVSDRKLSDFLMDMRLVRQSHWRPHSWPSH